MRPLQQCECVYIQEAGAWMREGRDFWLSLSDEDFFKLCRHEFSKGSGNGGQKRNKTSNAVRLTHEATGLSAYDCSSRSQHGNRAAAIFKLRCLLAMSLRDGDLPEVAPEVAVSNRDYALWLARVLDLFHEHGWDALAEVAAGMGVTKSKLVRLLGRDAALWQLVNRGRRESGLGGLRLTD